jgi:hypothetical protein
VSGFTNNDGSMSVGGLLPSGVGEALQLDASGNLKVSGAGTDTSTTGLVQNANDAVSIALPGGLCTALVQILGTFVGTLNFEASPDNGTTWYALQGNAVGTSTMATTATAPGAWRFNIAGFTNFHVRLSPVTSGSATIVIRVSAEPHNVFVTNASPLGQNVMANSSPVVLASDQSNVPVKAGFLEMASLTASALNADLVPSTEVSAFKWFSLHVTGTWSGTLTVQGSNDNVNFTNAFIFSVAPTGSFNANITANGIYNGPINFRYLRVHMTAYTSGTANGVLELYTLSPGLTPTLYTLQDGTWTVQPGNTANTTPWLVDASDRWARQMGQVDLARVLGAALSASNPAIVEQNVQNWIRNGAGFNGTSGTASVGAGTNAVEFSLFNPAASGKSVYVYSLKVTANLSGCFAVATLITTDPALTAASVTNTKAGGAASVASVTYSNSAQTQTGTVLDRLVIPGNNATQDFFAGGAGILLPAGSANGIAVFLNLTGAANWTVSARWAEF